MATAVDCENGHHCFYDDDEELYNGELKCDCGADFVWFNYLGDLSEAAKSDPEELKALLTRQYPTVRWCL